MARVSMVHGRSPTGSEHGVQIDALIFLSLKRSSLQFCFSTFVVRLSGVVGMRVNAQMSVDTFLT